MQPTTAIDILLAGLLETIKACDTIGEDAVTREADPGFAAAHRKIGAYLRGTLNAATAAAKGN